MDLTLSLAERWTPAGEPAGIGGSVEFRTDVFDAASIETLIARLARVLVALTADPARRLSSIDVLDAAELAELDGWGNRALLARPAPMASRFQSCSGRRRRALRGGGADLPGPLDDLSRAGRGRQPVGALAGCSGGGPGSVCGAAIFAFVEAIVSILAVLKTGAAYLPMDPGLPAARMEFMVGDSAPIAAVTTADFGRRLDGCGLVVIDVNEPRIADQPAAALVARPPMGSRT